MTLEQFKNILQELKEREIINQFANEKMIENYFIKNSNKTFKYYIGIDPTGPYPHLGHFVLFNIVRIFAKHDTHVTFVIGDFTALIGDPSGKNKERPVLEKKLIMENVNTWITSIKDIMNKYDLQENIKYSFKLNSEFWNKISMEEYFQKYGKLFSLASMLSKDMIKTRVESGISYTEFSYQVIQGLDFLWLNKEENVVLQIGGADQWGNIVSGIDVIQKYLGVDVFGLTTKLLLDENGQKLGKTSSKDVLFLFSPNLHGFQIYQYFINLSDIAARNLLLMTTNFSIEKINEFFHKLVIKNKIAQKELAKNYFKYFKTTYSFEKCVEFAKQLFLDNYDFFTSDDFNLLHHLIPKISENKIESNQTLEDFIFSSEKKIFNSKKEFRDLIKQGAIKINGKKINSSEFCLADTKSFVHSSSNYEPSFYVLSIGKKTKYIINTKYFSKY